MINALGFLSLKGFPVKNLVVNCVDVFFTAANVLLLLKSQVLSLLQSANFIIIIHMLNFNMVLELCM